MIIYNSSPFYVWQNVPFLINHLEALLQSPQQIFALTTANLIFTAGNLSITTAIFYRYHLAVSLNGLQDHFIIQRSKGEGSKINGWHFARYILNAFT